MGKEIVSIDPMVLEYFINYQWPGNVRELQNVLERMINIAHTSKLTVDLLPGEIIDSLSPENAEEEVESVDRMERELILKLLRSQSHQEEHCQKTGHLEKHSVPQAG